jgi:hypothetical protein
LAISLPCLFVIRMVVVDSIADASQSVGNGLLSVHQRIFEMPTRQRRLPEAELVLRDLQSLRNPREWIAGECDSIVHRCRVRTYHPVEKSG